MKIFYNKFFIKILFFLGFFVVNSVFLMNSSQALNPEARLSNPDDENRAMNLFLQVRCLVCNGQVIENSDSKFAFDVRSLIREQISQGKTDDDIKENLVATFGEDILNQPKTSSILLLALISLSLSAVIFFRVFAGRK
jgi:cytochrome c-type biogenesis protein CcmH/NrfF